MSNVTNEALLEAPATSAEVYRLTEVDFEERTITLRVLGHRHISYASGNYVVLPQADFLELRDAALLARGGGQ